MNITVTYKDNSNKDVPIFACISSTLESATHVALNGTFSPKEQAEARAMCWRVISQLQRKMEYQQYEQPKLKHRLAMVCAIYKLIA